MFLPINFLSLIRIIFPLGAMVVRGRATEVLYNKALHEGLPLHADALKVDLLWCLEITDAGAEL